MDDKKKQPPEVPQKPADSTTDPQEQMEGPVSSAMQNIKEEAEKNDEESKEEADRKKDENT
jgi:hypothetical protein